MYLRQAIESIINQDYSNLEYIIVDPGSTDGSRKIIEEYRDRVDHIIFEPDEGPADGLNKGFAKATGDIYGYLNSDDILYSGTLERVSELFTAYPHIDVISGHGHHINSNNEQLKKIFSHQFNLKQYLYGHCVLIQQSTFFRSKSFFHTICGFNVKNKIAWDGELMVDLYNTGASFRVFHEYWSGFRMYNQSISGSSQYLKKLNADYQRLKEKYDFPNLSVFRKSLLWLINWLRQPMLLSLRIYSSIQEVINTAIK
jgi:glycosyltransferase involved in cell wall biosynthesis